MNVLNSLFLLGLSRFAGGWDSVAPSLQWSMWGNEIPGG